MLLERRARSFWNTLRKATPYAAARNGAFGLAGLGLLVGLYCGFYRLLAYLAGVPLIGSLLMWKLTAMLMLTTFTMVGISSLLTSLTTLYYSFDLKFLMNAPLRLRAIFIDKSLESIFFASWMIGLVLIPYVMALTAVNGWGAGFVGAFLILLLPFLALAASVGIGFTLVLLYLFPSSRTRDVIWILSSLSLTFLYGAIRFAEPERLVRPDALHAVTEYLHFLQTPTAEYFPSWWLTKALRAWTAGHKAVFWQQAGLLAGTAAAVYAALVALAGKLYFAGYSGAQEGRLRRVSDPIALLPESGWARAFGLATELAPLFWKERKVFFRDVKHWSQILLVFGLIFVYLFSIRRLPLDNADLRSLVSFLNVGTAGFVIAALGLRFTYPAISLEGRNWWCCARRRSPWGDRAKFFSAVPMTAMARTRAGHQLDLRRRPLHGLGVGGVGQRQGPCSMGAGFGALFDVHGREHPPDRIVLRRLRVHGLGLGLYRRHHHDFAAVQMHFQVRFGNACLASRGVLAALASGSCSMPPLIRSVDAGKAQSSSSKPSRAAPLMSLRGIDFASGPAII